MIKTSKELSQRLKFIRKELNLTQLEVVKDSDIKHQSILSRIESGNLGSFENVFKLIQFYSQYISIINILSTDFILAPINKEGDIHIKVSLKKMKALKFAVNDIITP